MGRVEPEEDRDYPAHLRMKDVFGYHSMTFLHRVPAAVLVLENGKIIFANTAVKRLFGWGSRDLRKKTLDLIAAGNDHGNRFRQLAEKAGGGGNRPCSGADRLCVPRRQEHSLRGELPDIF
ncbi:MAG: PAS domain S-box protein [Desulfomonilia bacterium]